jgi:HK97 family phage prohead protease
MSYYDVKNCSLDIKDISEKEGIVSGYLSAFGFKDSDGDIIQKGAFTRTIKERGPQSEKPRIKYLLDHRTDKAIGVFQELKEDAKG